MKFYQTYSKQDLKITEHRTADIYDWIDPLI